MSIEYVTKETFEQLVSTWAQYHIEQHNCSPEFARKWAIWNAHNMPGIAGSKCKTMEVING